MSGRYCLHVRGRRRARLRILMSLRCGGHVVVEMFQHRDAIPVRTMGKSVVISDAEPPIIIRKRCVPSGARRKPAARLWGDSMVILDPFPCVAIRKVSRDVRKRITSKHFRTVGWFPEFPRHGAMFDFNASHRLPTVTNADNFGQFGKS